MNENDPLTRFLRNNRPLPPPDGRLTMEDVFAAIETKRPTYSPALLAAACLFLVIATGLNLSLWFSNSHGTSIQDNSLYSSDELSDKSQNVGSEFLRILDAI